jgi:hypothetical protein
MLPQIKEGSYVYIPSSTLLFKFVGDTDLANCTNVLGEPVYVVFLGPNVKSGFSDVFFDGQVWSVHDENIYEGERGE